MGKAFTYIPREGTAGGGNISSARLDKILAVTCHNYESLVYLREGLNELATKNNLVNEYAGLMMAVNQLAESVEHTEKNRDNGWNGSIDLTQMDQTDFGAFHSFLADKSANIIPAETYTWHYSVNPEGQHIRAVEKAVIIKQQNAASEAPESNVGQDSSRGS